MTAMAHRGGTNPWVTGRFAAISLLASSFAMAVTPIILGSGGGPAGWTKPSQLGRDLLSGDMPHYLPKFRGSNFVREERGAILESGKHSGARFQSHFYILAGWRCDGSTTRAARSKTSGSEARFIVYPTEGLPRAPLVNCNCGIRDHCGIGVEKRVYRGSIYFD